ncbi:MAG: replication-associated recombination protein A [Candidatus Woesebacteria bacterium]|nr:MAG: replication-associated recombination protein A [Candidatus Woesebacteria bacterium]
MSNIPLPELLRPKTLKDFVGQENLVGPNGIISKLFLAQRRSKSEVGFPSLIFWGPPGTGKTTLARIIANTLKRDFYEFSAVNAKIKDIEKVVEEDSSQSPLIFIDEIHRFNKAQQDKLLPYVESGKILFIGATTENPSFEVIGPLLSRCRVLILAQLSEKDLLKILTRALKYIKKKVNKKAEKFLLEASNGDARVMLNVIEIASQLSRSSTRASSGQAPLTLLLSDIETALQRRQYTFDKNGDQFYDVISAFIKSMRASDTDAALYYLARMVAAGQDPLYIARRMVVFASEDVASPTALVVANAVFAACNTIGYPECQENLAAGVVYLSEAKKDRSAYNAYMEALADVNKFGNLPVPLKIRNPVTKLMKDVGYGKGYDKYTKESLLPDKLNGKRYYRNGKTQSD